MTNQKMNTLQRKIKKLKSKLKLKIKNTLMSESKESKESDYKTSDLIWVGGFQSRKRKTKKKARKTSVQTSPAS